MSIDTEVRIQQAAFDLEDLEQVWMQLAVRAAADGHGVDAVHNVAHASHDSSITVATIHA